MAPAAPTLDAGRAFGVISTVPVEVVEAGVWLRARALRLDGDLDHPAHDRRAAPPPRTGR